MLLPGDWSSLPSEDNATDCDDAIWDMLLRGLGQHEQNEQVAPGGETQNTEAEGEADQAEQAEKGGSDEEEEGEEEDDAENSIASVKEAWAHEHSRSLLAEP